ncbi:thyrostimulin beta-5 subunit-like [Stegodyphus dumicola]|uniref:thyrostimulin beta-5 subunit-like n=1 Tax=Stegodyphus dumicola TaxID=202533 RepID=UPI0015AD6F9F|nr:thyrostimulin beta-5 subunit-like [Stegodyphus dumicola]
MLGHHTIGILLIAAWLSTVDPELVIDPETTLECHRREFTFRASQTDASGRQCWDHVTAMSCWGRCDSGEIGDWRFPFKRPFHPVCVHESRQIRYTLLENCDPGADISTAAYEYYEATSCACLKCDSSTTSCQGIPTLDQHQHQNKEVFSAPVTKPGRILPTGSLD